MKKTLLAFCAVTALSGFACAASFTTPLQTCSSANGANGATSFSATELVCGQFNSLPGGDTLTGVNVFISDSFNQGVPGDTNIFDFTYTSIDPDILGTVGTAPNSCITLTGATSLGACLDTVSPSANSFGVSGSAFYQLGEAITVFTAETYVGAGTFNVASVSALGEAGSALNSSGQLGSTAFVTFTYSTPTTGTPEPGSMMLLGSGLLAAGLIGRKKFAAK